MIDLIWMATTTGLVILAAAAGEGLIEFLIVPIVNAISWTTDIPEHKERRTVILNLLSALLGVGIALNFHLGIFLLMGTVGRSRSWTKSSPDR